MFAVVKSEGDERGEGEKEIACRFVVICNLSLTSGNLGRNSWMFEFLPICSASLSR